MEFVKRIETLFRTGTAGGVTDAQLLERFLEAAATTPKTHSPPSSTAMAQWSYASAARSYPPKKTPKTPPRPRSWSWHVCARSIGRRESLACWLHGVARRVAANLRAGSHAPAKLEHREGELRAAGQVVHGDFDAIENQDDWVRLHDELGSLPRSFREPLILCYLDGLTQEQAAMQLQCPLGTIQSRLARGRAKLKTRLEKSGRVLHLPSPLRATATASRPAPPRRLGPRRPCGWRVSLAPQSPRDCGHGLSLRWPIKYAASSSCPDGKSARR